MAEKELTSEQKEFISALAVSPEFAADVSILREIKNAMLEGMSIEEVKSKFLSGKKENPNQDPRAEPKEIVKETIPMPTIENRMVQEEEMEDKTYESIDIQEEMSVGEIEQELYPFDPFSSSEKVEGETSVKENEQVDNSQPLDHASTKQEDASELLRMAQEAVQQLNEVKLKYEIMDEFIQKHILEQKERQISELRERNRKLEEELSGLRSTIRAAPEVVKAEHKAVEEKQVVVLKKKERKIGFARFLKKDHSENYIIRLFSNPKFTAEQIAEIRLGLEADLSESQIKSYAKQELSARQMKEIRMLYEMQNQKQREE